MDADDHCPEKGPAMDADHHCPEKGPATTEGDPGHPAKCECNYGANERPPGEMSSG